MAFIIGGVTLTVGMFGILTSTISITGHCCSQMSQEKRKIIKFIASIALIRLAVWLMLHH